MTEELPYEDEKFIWYDHPVGFHLYIREEVDGETVERVVFGQQAQASFHAGRKHLLNLSEFGGVEKLSKRLKDFLWVIEEERQAVEEEEEDKIQQLSQLRKMIMNGMDYKEKSLSNAILGAMSKSSGLDTGVPEIEELIELGHSNHDDEKQSNLEEEFLGDEEE